MHKKLSFQLFGSPQIYLDDEPVFFSFSKVNALLYYLVVHSSVSRNEAAGILWPNKSEKSAKKNLRNTIYQANKELDAEVIVSPNKTILQLSNCLTISSDVERFSADPMFYLDEYRDEFLKGFYLKDSEMFDLWTVKMRSSFEQKFIRACYQKVEHDIKVNRLEDVEKNIRRLIAIDEYDERNYQMLMEFYQNSDRSGKVIETYYELANLLGAEMGIDPSEKTREIYEQTLTIVHQKEEQKSSFNNRFYGRTREIEVLEGHLSCFTKKRSFHSVLVQGDAGVGKTALCQQVLKYATEKKIITVSCYQTEQKFSLRIWREIIDQLILLAQQEPKIDHLIWEKRLSRFFPCIGETDTDEFDPSVDEQDINYLSQVLLSMLNRLSQTSQLVFFIENIQWCDQKSLQLLTSLMLHNKTCFFLLTIRSGYSRELTDFVHILSNYNKLIKIKLTPFPSEEVKAFIEKQLPSVQVDHLFAQKLYQESAGYPLFLMEYARQLNNDGKIEFMTEKIQHELEFMMLQLSELEEKILQAAAYFRDQAPVSMLAEVVERPVAEVVKAVSDLTDRKLVSEFVLSGKIIIRIKLQKLKEYLYQKQIISKLRVTHEKIAEIFESHWKISQEKGLLAEVAYHYKCAHQELKSLDYQLSELTINLRYQHELFPIYPEANQLVVDFQPSEEQKELEHLNQIGEQLKDLELMYGEEDDYKLLWMKYLYLEGRCFITIGNYQRGIENIQQVIVKAMNDHNEYYLLKAYRQMIYYFIQTDNANDMQHYIELAMTVAIKTNDHEAIGVLLRLKGLHRLMIGEIEEAKRLLHESMTIFTISEDLKDKYASNIAAIYDYLAEIERISGNYLQAITYHKKAIALCEDREAWTGLAIFYVDMGISLFMTCDYSQAKAFLQKAKRLYRDLSSSWKKIQMDVYLALIELREENYSTIFALLTQFSKMKEQFLNPRDLGLIAFLQAILKLRIMNNTLHAPEIAELLEKSEHYYYEQALENLSPYRDQFELRCLEEQFDKSDVDD